MPFTRVQRVFQDVWSQAAAKQTKVEAATRVAKALLTNIVDSLCCRANER